MKSVLQEGSTVEKAVVLAWQEAGQPIEFTIKVLEKGEKGFLGFSSHPAVVSIIYDLPVPKKQERNRPQRRAPRPRNDQAEKAKPAPRIVARPMIKADKPEKSEPIRQRRVVTPAEKKPVAPKPAVSVEKKDSKLVENKVDEKKRELWLPEFVDDLKIWFAEALKIVGTNSEFDVKVEGALLTLKLKEPFSESKDSSRALYASLSFLLIQCLKKKHRKRLRGYKLLVTA